MKKKNILLLFPILLLTVQACTFSLLDLGGTGTSPNNGGDIPPTETPVPSAETNFVVHLPTPLNEGELLAISILDEVTGLPVNATNFPLQAIDALTYKVALPLPLDAVIKYRYILAGNTRAQETNSAGQPVRYRLYKVDGINNVEDFVTSWTGQNYTGPTGNIQGIVVDSVNGLPIPNLMVSTSGSQTLTDSAGQFRLVGIVPGLHRMTTYAMDGTHQVFQQGARVDAGLTTPVHFFVAPAAMVNITFIVALPDDTIQGAPVRLAGNLSQLGNSFGDLNAGFSTIADQMPVLAQMADGRYSITLSLPVGTDLRYKYTLGDGFWNAEQKAEGGHNLRRLVVPATDLVVEDKVDTWHSGEMSEIAFSLQVPDNTPAGDVIYIQLNPFAWTEPIPMWSLGDNHWGYKLFGPFDGLASFGYRYCRNAQCGSADDETTQGSASTGRKMTPTVLPQSIRDTVKSWAWLQNNDYTLVAAPIIARDEKFIAGIEFQSNFSPSWMKYTSQAMQNIQALNASWVFLTPTWTFSRQQPLLFNALPTQNPLWGDTVAMTQQARALDMNIALFPTPAFPVTPDEWWISAPRDFGWWNDWFDLYEAFALYHADIAAQNDAQMLVLGGDWLSPAFQNGMLANGMPSGVPADAELRWNAIITQVRAHFNGELWWALPYTPGSLASAPPFLSNVDGIYLLWDAPLNQAPSADKNLMYTEAVRLLDTEVLPYQNSMSKDLILGLAVPSATGAEAACIPDAAGGCLLWTALNRPQADIPTVQLNLYAQTNMYEVLLNALNDRDWISGIVSRGYYPPVMLQDKSASVYGKPAADVLWYWYPRLLGK